MTAVSGNIPSGTDFFETAAASVPQAADAIGVRNFQARTDTLRQSEAVYAPWGGAAGLWTGFLLPRLARLLPAQHVLEIGVGAGLLASCVRPLAGRYTGVDVCERSLRRARERLGTGEGGDSVRLILSDGRSLAEIADASVDVCLSWEALVHADRETMRATLSQLRAKLAPGGAALLHHSNLAQHVEQLKARSPTGVIDPQNPMIAGRHPSMSAELLRTDARALGLRVVAQELFGVTDHGLFTDACTFLLADAGGGALEPSVVYRHDWALQQREARRVAVTYRGTPATL